MSDRISVPSFLAEAREDINSPTTSNFTSNMMLCRSTIAALEESLDQDRSALKKMKNASKAMFHSGQAHLTQENLFIENLEKLGGPALLNSNDSDPDIGTAFLRLAAFSQELSSMLKKLVSNINNIILFPLDSLLKGDLKGGKGDMKRPFDKSWKDYDTKVKQVEREKRQLAKDAGMIRSEITGAEIADVMEKERRMFQLQMCEYLIKANEIKTKKGVEFLQHLVEFYHVQNTYFCDGVKVIEKFRDYANQLTGSLQSIRQSQDEERRQLVELRNVLKSSVSDNDGPGKSTANIYNLHQLQGNKELGNEKSGYLYKKSEGLRKAWQKRKCVVTEGCLTMSHNNASKIPVKLNLLTSQLKLLSDDKKQFDLVSHNNRTYRFMAEDENEAIAWVSVITNSKEDALNRVFGAESGKGKSEQNSVLKELTKSIISEVKTLPGNERCCDCNAPDPTWLSTNLGVLLCIECSGIHRDMGVHISRIQSITLDELGTSELLLARTMGNDSFNEVMEDKLMPGLKPTRQSDMEERKSFIRGKYISYSYAVQTFAGDQEALADEVGQAVRSCDMYALLQLFAEKANLSTPLPGYHNGETAFHVAASMETANGMLTVLALVDFMAQNAASGLNAQTDNGNTALHICCVNNHTECMKLLLRSKADTGVENAAGETPLAVAKRLDHAVCVELLEQANAGNFRQIVHIDIDWNLTSVDEEDFFSEDEEDKLGSNLNISGLASPMKTPDPSRGKTQSFKQRKSLNPGAPAPPPRNAPAVPPHKAINRNRSQTVTSSVSDHRRSDVRNLPPALPAKPDLPIKQQHPPGIKVLPAIPAKPHNAAPTLPAKGATTQDAMKSRSLTRDAAPIPFRPTPPAALPRTPGPPAPFPRGEPPPPVNQAPYPQGEVPPPVPPPLRAKKVRAIYDCDADNQDELTFVENEVIVVTGVEDTEWWAGHIEHQPHRSGVFPVSFVHILSD